HADPDAPTAGGTERHARALADALRAGGDSVLEFFPLADDSYVLQAFTPSGLLFREVLSGTLLTSAIEFIGSFVDTLHVHHTLNWPAAAIRAIAALDCPRKIISAHDYFLICPTIHMLRAPLEREFCGVEQDASACNECLRQQPGCSKMTIQVYRSKTFALLEKFDSLLFPSASVVRNFERAFGAQWKGLEGRASVLHHDIGHILERAGLPEARLRRPHHHIAFIGGLGPHKGSREILEALPRLRRAGLT